jgi:hypothetical protein
LLSRCPQCGFNPAKPTKKQRFVPVSDVHYKGLVNIYKAAMRVVEEHRHHKHTSSIEVLQDRVNAQKMIHVQWMQEQLEGLGR